MIVRRAYGDAVGAFRVLGKCPQVTFALEGGAHAVGRHREVEPLDDHARRVHARQRYALGEADHGR